MYRTTNLIDCVYALAYVDDARIGRK